jgi:hypothetical protein
MAVSARWVVPAAQFGVAAFLASIELTACAGVHPHRSGSSPLPMQPVGEVALPGNNSRFARHTDRIVRHRAVAPGECLDGAMNVISKADAPLTWEQPLRQCGTFIGQEGDRCLARQRRTDAANRRSARDRTTCVCETTATPAKARLVRYAVKVPSEANSGA